MTGICEGRVVIVTGAGRGIGRTKKGAEQAAAGGALAMLDSLPASPEPAATAPPAAVEPTDSSAG